MRALPLLLLIVAAPLRAEAPAAVDYAADARSIEGAGQQQLCLSRALARAPECRMTAKLRAEAAAVKDARQLVRYSERALALLADHHAITGGSMKDSWAVFPSYGDLWIEPRGGDFVITQLRSGSPAEQAGIRAGERLVEVDGQPVAAAVAAFWADLGTTGGGERDGYAARVLAGRAPRPPAAAHGPARRRSAPLSCS